MIKSVKIFHWLPRILCILAILFVSLFALDAFTPGMPVWKQILSLLIHLIPSFVLIALLIIAWKRELIGGLLFILIGVITSPFVFKQNYKMNHSILLSLSIILSITIPFVVVGILFVVSRVMKKKFSAK